MYEAYTNEKRKKTISFNRIQHFGYLSLKDWTKQENSHK